MRWRRKEGVKSQSKGMFYGARYNSLKNGAIDFKTRISITLDQIGFEFAADVEIQAIELKIMTFPLRIQILKTRPYHISRNLLHSVQNLLLKTIMLMRVVSIQVSLELTVR